MSAPKTPTEEGGDASIDGCFDVGCGTVSKLTPTAFGSWKLTVLYAFSGGQDGTYPLAGLIIDAAGGLYGTASEGGDFDYGAVFKVAPPAGGTGSFTTTVLRTFRSIKDGIYPFAGLTFGPRGNLYGTTYEGGYTGGSRA